MSIMDLKTETEWQRILEEVAEKFGVHTVLVDENAAILLNGGKYNPICTRVRSDSKTMTFVCSQTNRAMFQMARKCGKPCDDLCEAGMFKTVVPIFHDGEFLGGLSACGAAVSDEPVDAFLISKILGVDEADVGKLIGEVHTLDTELAEQISDEFLKLVA